MAAHVHVVLTEDIDKLGKAGELVRVKPGYARNYLIPRSLALRATAGQVSRIEHERAVVLSRNARLTKEAGAVAEKLAGVTLQFAKPAGEGDKLYGSVTAAEIVEALRAEGVEIDRKKLELPGAIKRLGEYEIKAKLGRQIEATFKVMVNKQE